MRNAIFYLTYNGLYNFTNGIGTQTQLLIAGLETLREKMAKTYGSIDLHVICPEPDAHTWNYDHGFYRRQRDRVRWLGGQVHLIPYKQHAGQDLWALSSWKSLCQNVAPLLREQTSAYERSLIICVDQPWLQTPYYLKTDSGLAFQHQIDTLLVPYSTAFIRYEGAPDTAEVAWEQHGLEASKPGSRVALADICPSFTEHLNAHFRLSAPQFAPYTSSILVADPTFVLDDEAALQNTIRRYGVPTDTDILLAFGRAAVIKGFEKLIPALAPLRDQIHFVLISVPYVGDESQQQVYDQLLRQNGLRATHIKAFTRDLPRALCQWPRTKVVVVPSRYETFSNIPVEVALWAREKGPVVVASAAGGFIDQIETGTTGFLTDTSSRQQLAQTLRLALDLSPEAHAAMRQRAYQRVVRLYDFNENFPATLRWFWEREGEQVSHRAN